MATSRLARGPGAGHGGGMASPRDSYWRLVFKRATKEARAALSIETGERVVIGIVVTITAIALLWLYGSEGSSLDAAIERVGPWIIIILAIYPVVLAWKFIRTPPHIDAELHERIESLQARLMPKLKFTWRPDDNKYLERGSRKTPRRERFMIGRVAVKNISEGETIRGVEVSVIHYRPDGGPKFKTLEKSLINNSTHERRTDLHASREANFDLFEVTEHGARLWFGPFVDGSKIAVRFGKYAIKVTASAQDMRRQDFTFFLYVEGFDKIEFRPWEPGDMPHVDTGSQAIPAEQSDNQSP